MTQVFMPMKKINGQAAEVKLSNLMFERINPFKAFTCLPITREQFEK